MVVHGVGGGGLDGLGGGSVLDGGSLGGGLGGGVVVMVVEMVMVDWVV